MHMMILLQITEAPPTGTNVPDYPKLAQLWWQNIGDASSGAKSPQEAMDALCAAQEKVLSRLERAGVFKVILARS